MIGRFLCYWFGHKWRYQSRAVSFKWGTNPARVCTRCVDFRLLERFVDGEWVRTENWNG